MGHSGVSVSVRLLVHSVAHVPLVIFVSQLVDSTSMLNGAQACPPAPRSPKINDDSGRLKARAAALRFSTQIVLIKGDLPIFYCY